MLHQPVLVVCWQGLQLTVVGQVHEQAGQLADLPSHLIACKLSVIISTINPTGRGFCMAFVFGFVHRHFSGVGVEGLRS